MKRLIPLLLTISLVLSLFGTNAPACAAPVFLDTINHAARNDIARLSALGIVTGYEDGTFRPDADITRAELIKILTLTLEQGRTARSLMNTATQFTDAPASQWYTGYVNVTAVNGIVKGYADGTVKPHASVTQAEAVTMMLRALGYSDYLPGTWPLNYIMKAADLGLVDSGFDADANATRAFICTAVVDLLTFGRASYDSDTNSFIDAPKDGGLLAGLSHAATAEARVVSYDATTGVLTLAGNPGATVKVAGDDRVVTGEGLSNLANRYISYMTHIVNGITEVIYIEVRTTVLTGRVAAIDTVNRRITLASGAAIELSEGAAITVNGVAASLIDLTGSDITALLQADGKAYDINARRLDTTGILTGKQTVTANSGTTNTITVGGATYTVATDAGMVRNGTTASFADLQIGDDIMLLANGGTATAIDAFAMTKTAIVSSVSVSGDSRRILSISFTDGITAVNGTASSVQPGDVTVGHLTTFRLNRDRQIVAKIAETATVSTVTGRIEATGITIKAGGQTSYIALDNGSTYDLADGATFDRNTLASSFAALKAGDIAVVSLDNADKVIDIAAYANGLLPTVDRAALFSGNLAPGAVITLNAATSDIATVTTATDIFVTWDVNTGQLDRVDAFTWASVSTVLGTTVTVDCSGATTYVVDTIAGGIILGPDCVIMKDGVTASFADIQTGDEIKVATGTRYVKVTTDD